MFEHFSRKISVIRLQNRRINLLTLALIIIINISILVVACGRDAQSPELPTNAPARNQEALPGTEEFGLSKEGLV